MVWRRDACILANGIMLVAALLVPGKVMGTTTGASAVGGGTDVSVETVGTTTQTQTGGVSVETIGTTTLSQTGGVSVETIGTTTQTQTGGVSVETIGTTVGTTTQSGGVSVETITTTAAPATLTTTTPRTYNSSTAWTTTRHPSTVWRTNWTGSSSAAWTTTHHPTTVWRTNRTGSSSAAWSTTSHAGSSTTWTWTHHDTGATTWTTTRHYTGTTWTTTRHYTGTTWTTTHHHGGGRRPCHGERLPEAHVTAAYTLSMEVTAPSGLADEAVFCRLQAKIQDLKALLRSRGLSQEWDVAAVHFTNLLANKSLRPFMHRMVVNHSWSRNTSTGNPSSPLQRLKINGTSINFVPSNGTCKDGFLALDDGVMVAQVITAVNATVLLIGRGEGGKIEHPNLSSQVIHNATITRGVIANATLIDSKISGALCVNVTFINSNVSGVSIVNSTVIDSKIMSSSIVGSTVLRSDMNKSNVNDSSIVNSFMSSCLINGSTLRMGRAENSEVHHSDVFESTLSQCKTLKSNVSCWSCGGALDWSLDHGFDSDHTIPSPPMMHHAAGGAAMGHVPEFHELEREGEQDVSEEVKVLFGGAVRWADLHWTVQEYEECGDVGLPTEPWFWPTGTPPPCPDLPPYMHYRQAGVLTLVFSSHYPIYHYHYDYYNGHYYDDYHYDDYYNSDYYGWDYYFHIAPAESPGTHGEAVGQGPASGAMTTTEAPHGRFLAPAESRRRLQDRADRDEAGSGREDREERRGDNDDEDRERRRNNRDDREESAAGGHSPEPHFLPPHYGHPAQSEEARLLDGALEVYFGHHALNVDHIQYSRNWGVMDAAEDHPMPGHSASGWIYPTTSKVQVYFTGDHLNSPTMSNAALVKNLQLLLDVSSWNQLSNRQLISATVLVDGMPVHQELRERDDDDDEEGAWVWVFRAALIIVPNCMLCALCQLGFIWFICIRRNSRTHPPMPVLAKEPVVGNIVEESNNNNPIAVKASTIGKDAEKNAETMSCASTRSGSSLEKNPVALAAAASAEELA